MVLQRAVKISLKWIGPRNQRRIRALLEAYRGAVNFFVRLLWREPNASFSTATSKRLRRTRLSARYRDQALKQAVELVSATRKSAQALGVKAGRPYFRGSAVLDAKFVRIEQRPGAEHDLLVHLSCLDKGKPLRLRSRGTRMLKKWLGRPGARLVRGCAVGDGDLLTLWVELPAPEKRKRGEVLGVDVGVHKLLATSAGALLGTEFRAVRDKVRRRRPGSKGRRRARRERDQLICTATKRLPWASLRAVAFEDLRGIKRGKKRGQGRRLRRSLAAWRPPLVEQRLRCLAAEEGVLAVAVPGFGNSTTCPCGHRSRKNRRGAVFRCVLCGFEDDADLVGARAARDKAYDRLAECRAAWERECAQAQARRERRRLAAKKRGAATAAKWRRKKAAAAAKDQ